MLNEIHFPSVLAIREEQQSHKKEIDVEIPLETYVEGQQYHLKDIEAEISLETINVTEVRKKQSKYHFFKCFTN